MYLSCWQFFCYEKKTTISHCFCALFRSICLLKQRMRTNVKPLMLIEHSTRLFFCGKEEWGGCFIYGRSGLEWAYPLPNIKERKKRTFILFKALQSGLEEQSPRIDERHWSTPETIDFTTAVPDNVQSRYVKCKHNAIHIAYRLYSMLNFFFFLCIITSAFPHIYFLLVWISLISIEIIYI